MHKIYLMLSLLFLSPGYIYAQNIKTLKIDEFLSIALEKDTRFEEILIEELSLNYLKDRDFSSDEILLDIKGQYEFSEADDSWNPSMELSLDKLIPHTATSFSTDYTLARSDGSYESEFSVLVTQEIARNAFGKLRIYQERLLDLSIDLNRYQIVEAYEDYMAAVITAYYDWYLAYENLEIGKSSYKQNSELLANINKRLNNNIALPIDVNKVHVQVLVKKESLINLEKAYEKSLNHIKQILRHDTADIIIPSNPVMYEQRNISFQNDYAAFVKASRTYNVLRLLEEQSDIDVKTTANSLLPSTNFLLGVDLEGEDVFLKSAFSDYYIAVDIELPLPDKSAKAQHAISKISRKKTSLSNKNKFVQLKTDLENINIQIQKQKELIQIAEKKISLAQSILEDETQNYSYGKVSLNDFIDAVNRVDENKFNLIQRSVQMKILMTEWLRMTDQLVTKKILQK